MRGSILGVQRARGKGETNRGSPVGCSEAESIGMEKTFARIARQADGRSKLERVGFLGPRQIIPEVVQVYLEIVAVIDALIQAEECIPCLIVRGVTDNAETLPGESPYKRVSKSGAQNRSVSEGKPFAVIARGLLRRVAREERGPRVAQVLRGPSPEQQLLAVRGDSVIDSSDENVVIQAGRCAKNEASIVETISSGGIVGYCLTGAESFVEIPGVAGVQHGGINANAPWVEVREVPRRKCD